MSVTTVKEASSLLRQINAQKELGLLPEGFDIATDDVKSSLQIAIDNLDNQHLDYYSNFGKQGVLYKACQSEFERIIVELADIYSKKSGISFKGISFFVRYKHNAARITVEASKVCHGFDIELKTVDGKQIISFSYGDEFFNVPPDVRNVMFAHVATEGFRTVELMLKDYKSDNKSTAEQKVYKAIKSRNKRHTDEFRDSALWAFDETDGFTVSTKDGRAGLDNKVNIPVKLNDRLLKAFKNEIKPNHNLFDQVVFPVYEKTPSDNKTVKLIESVCPDCDPNFKRVSRIHPTHVGTCSYKRTRKGKAIVCKNIPLITLKAAKAAKANAKADKLAKAKPAKAAKAKAKAKAAKAKAAKAKAKA